MLLWIIGAALAAWYGTYRYRRRGMYRLAATVRGSRHELPVLGITHLLMGDTEDIMRALQGFSREAMEYDGYMRGWLGPKLYYVCVHPADLEVVLKTCLEKDDLHRFIRRIIGNGGIFAPVSIWRRRRKVIVPAFSPKVLDTFVEVFAEQSEVLAARLAACAARPPFSIWPYLSSYTLDAVCETAMGVQIHAQSDTLCPFLSHMNQILNLVTERIFHLWLQQDWTYRLFRDKYARHETCLANMHGFTDKVIQNKREEVKNAKLHESDKDPKYELSSYGRASFLDLLIRLSGGGGGYTDLELREEVLTLAVAGTDTSAVAIGYTLQLLAKYPAVQRRVYDELLEVFGDSERPLDRTDLRRLALLERVVKESMRLFPPVPFIIRKVLRDMPMPSGRVLPAGSGVVVSIWGLHRDPRYWGPRADHFDPDRFLPERLQLPHPCCYMPFSSGPRNCVGYQYALMSVKTALSAILRRYEVLGEPEPGPVPHIPVKLDIMMKAVDGYKVALRRRGAPQGAEGAPQGAEGAPQGAEGAEGAGAPEGELSQ